MIAPMGLCTRGLRDRMVHVWGLGSAQAAHHAYICKEAHTPPSSNAQTARPCTTEDLCREGQAVRREYGVKLSGTSVQHSVMPVQ